MIALFICVGGRDRDSRDDRGGRDRDSRRDDRDRYALSFHIILSLQQNLRHRLEDLRM